MMGAVRSWLLAVIAVSLLCAVADALIPSGGVKRVGRLVCGLVLMGAILSPVASLDVEGSQRWLESCLASVRSQEAELEDRVNGQMKVIIEREYAAYIVDKAAQLGLECTVRVECRLSEEGLYLPDRTEAEGLWTASAQEEMIRIIAEDLGVPAQRQIYLEKEEIP
ncbi:stage III sporulation protein AF [Flintibacter muris]|uniref:stage III sporulation protein AF n=1 Tax=Flintibacter muris TaxID=2941327 RepID=UPI00203C5D17|nr:stage III sporulation protein AF [Flintibacter muris]